jgi:hypothetical protein
MAAWFDGLRAGRAFVSSGPLVEMIPILKKKLR